VETPDDYTLLIRTKHPFAPFLNNMCHPVGSMISPAALEKYGKDIGRHPVGTGKFVFEKWLPNQRIVLKRNDNYWGPKPSLTTVNLIPIPEEGTRTMAFESGEIDIVSAPAPHRVAKFKKDDDVTVTVTPAARTVWLGYNLKDKVLSNPKVREAIALAINRKELVNDVAEGLALDATGWIPSIIQKSDQNFNYPYDPAKAKKLLAEAGYPNGLDIKLWTPEGRYLKDRQIAEALQAQLSDVGIRAHLSVMEWAAYVAALFRSEQQLFIWGWAFQVGDPDSMLRENFYSTSSYGCTGYQNQEFDKMLDKAVSTFDPESRKKQYDAIQQLLFKDVVGAPIYFSENIFAMHNNVNGFIPHPLELIVLDKTKVKED
jgi:peptide/nickel transport system substrate-binding protein